MGTNPFKSEIESSVHPHFGRDLLAQSLADVQCETKEPQQLSVKIVHVYFVYSGCISNSSLVTHSLIAELSWSLALRGSVLVV